MFKTHKFVQFVFLTITILSIALLPNPFESASALAANEISNQTSTDKIKASTVDGFLNPDGTLKLDGNFSGSIDLQGWNVEIDESRGPIFVPMQSSEPGSPQGWSALGSGVFGTGSLYDPVWAIAVSGNDVYVGGFFSHVRNRGKSTTADYIAKWDGENWSALGSNGAATGALTNFVTSIAVVGTDIYVGGAFENVNNNGTVLTAADYIAKWDGTNWSALGSNSAGNGSLNGSVTSIAASGNDLYVGGVFDDVNNNGTVLTAADYIAKWNGTSWSALGSNGAGDGSLSWVPRVIAASGSNVYVGGEFVNVNNKGTVLTAADYIAKWDGTNWSAFGSNGAGDGSLSNTVWAIALSGSDVFVGGQFTDVNNNGTILTAGDWIAKWDGTNWSALGSNGIGNGAIQGTVLGLAASGGDIYAGGWFFDVNNNGSILDAADYVAKWDGANWSALGSNGSGDGSISDAVWEVAASGNNIYIGGDFTDVNNGGTVLSAADYVARYSIEALPTSSIQVEIGGSSEGTYSVPLGQSIADNYGINGGPVHVTSIDGVTPIFTSERAIFGNSFNSIVGYPGDQLTTDYWFTSYDDVGMITYLVIGNPDPALTAEVDVYIAGSFKGHYSIAPGQRVFPRYGINGGPVHVVSTNGVNIFSSERTKFGNSFNEVMGYPGDQLTTEYWFTSYDDLGMITYLVIGNPSGSQTAEVDVYIAGIFKGHYSIAPGQRVFPRYGINGGPVQVVSTNSVSVFASERTKFGNTFNEVMGYPGDQLSTEYWFTSYDDTSMITYLVVGNPHPTEIAEVDVYIGGIFMNNYFIVPGQRIFRRYGINAGPVRVVSTNGVDVFASERSKYLQSFNEILGIADTQLTTDYWFTSYDDLGMTTFLVIGAP